MIVEEQMEIYLLASFFPGLVDTIFTMDSLISQLELSANMCERAERYELLGNLYRILIPIYESRRNYPALVQCYSHLYEVSKEVPWFFVCLGS